VDGIGSLLAGGGGREERLSQGFGQKKRSVLSAGWASLDGTRTRRIRGSIVLGPGG